MSILILGVTIGLAGAILIYFARSELPSHSIRSFTYGDVYCTAQITINEFPRQVYGFVEWRFVDTGEEVPESARSILESRAHHERFLSWSGRTSAKNNS
jgi:hypothetical protein